jgi:hypothetical protein
VFRTFEYLMDGRELELELELVGAWAGLRADLSAWRIMSWRKSGISSQRPVLAAAIMRGGKMSSAVSVLCGPGNRAI